MARERDQKEMDEGMPSKRATVAERRIFGAPIRAIFYGCLSGAGNRITISEGCHPERTAVARRRILACPIRATAGKARFLAFQTEILPAFLDIAMQLHNNRNSVAGCWKGM